MIITTKPVQLGKIHYVLVETPNRHYKPIPMTPPRIDVYADGVYVGGSQDPKELIERIVARDHAEALLADAFRAVTVILTSPIK